MMAALKDTLDARCSEIAHRVFANLYVFYLLLLQTECDLVIFSLGIAGSIPTGTPWRHRRGKFWNRLENASICAICWCCYWQLVTLSNTNEGETKENAEEMKSELKRAFMGQASMSTWTVGIFTEREVRRWAGVEVACSLRPLPWPGVGWHVTNMDCNGGLIATCSESIKDSRKVGFGEANIVFSFWVADLKWRLILQLFP